MFRKYIVICIIFISIGIAAYCQDTFRNRYVSETLIAQVDYSRLAKGSFRVSPDSRRIAYTIMANDKQFVVIDGKEEKHYDGIGKGTPIFSPDSKRVAYIALVDEDQFCSD